MLVVVGTVAVVFFFLLLFVYFFVLYANSTATLTALQNNRNDSINKTKKNSTKQFFLKIASLLMVKRPGAQGLAYAVEHFPFQHNFIYIIGCHL